MNITKGEWKVGTRTEHNFHANLLMIIGGYDANLGGNPAVCYVNDLVGEEAEANANLIAAAPNQNQALTEIDQWLIEHPDISDDPQLHIIQIHIQDALAKAEGK